MIFIGIPGTFGLQAGEDVSAIFMLALSGCGGQQKRMAVALDGYIGSSVARFVADHGYPTSSVKISDDQSSFRWVITGPGMGAIVPVGGALVVAPPGQRVCTVVLTASKFVNNPELKDWIIQGWRWEGAC